MNGMISEALEATGLTYRQLDYWTRTGRIHAAAAVKGRRVQSGTARVWPDSEIRIAALIARLTALGLNLDVAARVARECVSDILEREISPDPIDAALPPDPIVLGDDILILIGDA